MEMQETENVVLICEDSPEGIFTGIYDAYTLKMPHERISLQIRAEENMKLFTVYRMVETDEKKARKVMCTLQRRFWEKDYAALCMALAAEDERKADAVYKTIVRGLKEQYSGSILAHMADDGVRTVVELSRRSSNELQRMREFLRFSELENGILSARIAPKDNVLPMVAAHFADRLPMENFLIFDEKRTLYAVHPAGRDWFLMDGNMVKEQEDRKQKISAGEEYYQELFRAFCHSISIDSRKNLKLQQNMLPLRFRPFMTEFQKK